MAEPEEEAKERGGEGRGQHEPAAEKVGWDEGPGHAIQRRAGMDGEGGGGQLPTTSGFTCDAAVATAHLLWLSLILASPAVPAPPSPRLPHTTASDCP